MTIERIALGVVGAAARAALDERTEPNTQANSIPAPRGLKPWHWLLREALVNGAPGIRALAVLLAVILLGGLLVVTQLIHH